MPLIEAAFRRAQEKAQEAYNKALLTDVDAGEEHNRALIEAYLSDGDVYEAAHTGLVRKVDMFTDDEDVCTRIVLQAIGAKEAP